ncbi:hypothetical protein SeMB42_g03184 [Synchytrium endobioticum]|uniref:PCI domain-containing protein n=1 Tax=Synchytrium endobioticum TaxID=286115 RepID=A0A507CY64_9FUNG|nr:hypothetical protein SeLEV6574_g04739 [Synchytrium endobioticum]TPX47845.1 hypothetical protein SeMB42_g03184 [Synchytrium endobioticum]
MAEAVLVASTSHRVEQFLLLAKGTKGGACVKLIGDVLGAYGVYVFGEFLDMQNVRELAANSEFEPYHRLLCIFAYGTYQDYKENASSLPPLSPTQLQKLKHLSLVTLSEQTRSLKYEQLQQYLDIDSIRELEDLIIDAIYNGVIKGKLDQKKSSLEVEYAMGRDLRPAGQSAAILSLLSNWIATSETLLKALDEKVLEINVSNAAYKADKEEWEKNLEKMKADLKAQGPPTGRSKVGSGEDFDAFRFMSPSIDDRDRDFMDFTPDDAGRRQSKRVPKSSAGRFRERR